MGWLSGCSDWRLVDFADSVVEVFLDVVKDRHAWLLVFCSD